jgi:branched-chain amino acid aminotransferase
MLECIKELLRIDKDWIPTETGYSLYLRPTAIATQRTLGVGQSDSALLYCIASPVGPYYKTGFSAVSLYATRDFVRAWPGGTGDSKLGANYAPGILPQLEVAKQGYQQILWMFGKEDYVTEVGTMNFFCYWVNESGQTGIPLYFIYTRIVDAAVGWDDSSRSHTRFYLETGKGFRDHRG